MRGLFQIMALMVGFGLSTTGTSSLAQEVLSYGLDIDRRVFVGKEHQMPVNGKIYLTVRPDTRHPKTVAEAIRLMRQRLPRWYLNALYRSRGPYECSVIVREDQNRQVNYTGIVNAWFWREWNLQREDNPIRKELSRLGALHYSAAEPVLSYGFCQFVKTNDMTWSVNAAIRPPEKGAVER